MGSDGWIPNSAQTNTTGPSRPSTGRSGRARSSSRTCARRSIRSRVVASPAAAVRRVRREVLELAHGVPAVDLPGVRVERAEQLGPVRIPRPAVVERDPGQRRQLRREPPGEARGALVRLPGARQARRCRRSAWRSRASKLAVGRAVAVRGNRSGGPEARDRRGDAVGERRPRERADLPVERRPPRARRGRGARRRPR